MQDKGKKATSTWIRALKMYAKDQNKKFKIYPKGSEGYKAAQKIRQDLESTDKK